MKNCYYPPNQTSVTIASNSSTQITITSSPLTPFDRITNCLLKLRIDTTNCDLSSSTLDVNKIVLSDNNNNLIDNSQLIYVDNAGYFFLFDATKMYLNDHSTSHTFYITNNTSYYFIINLVQSFVEIESISPFETIKNHNYINKEIGKSYQLKVDNISLYPYLSKSLFNNIFKNNYSLIYDYYDPNSNYLFFPKGWKLSILEKLFFTIDDEIYLEDSSFNKRFFNETSTSNIFIDSSKTGLLLELLNNGTYKLYHPLTDSYKIYTHVFNDDDNYYLTKIVDEGGNEINITYTTTSITITDSNNNVVSINKVSSTKVTISTIIGSEMVMQSHNLIEVDLLIEYTLNISNNRLTSLTYESHVPSEISDRFYQTNTDSFSYDNDNRLEELVTFDNYILTISLTDSSIDVTIEYGNETIDNFTINRYYNHVITNDELKDIETISYFDEDGKTIFNAETPVDIKSGTFINTTPLNSSSSRININNMLRIHQYDPDSNTYVITIGSSDHTNNQPFQECLFSDLFTIELNTYYLLMVNARTTNRKFPTKHNENRYCKVFFGPVLGDKKSIIELNGDGLEFKSALFYADFSDNDVEVYFEVSNNWGTFELLDVYLTKVDLSFSSILYINNLSQNPALSFNNNSYDNLYELKYSNHLLFESDITTNRLLYCKNNNTNIFYTDDLTNVIIGNNNIGVNINNQNNSTLFSSIDFGYLSFKDKVKYVSLIYPYVIQGQNEPHYEIETNIIKGEHYFTYSVIKNYHGDTRIEESIFEVDNNYNPKKILKSSSYHAPNMISTTHVESLVDDKFIYHHTYTYDSCDRLINETYHVGNTSVAHSYTYYQSFEIPLSNTDPKNKVTNYSYERHYEYASSISKSNHYVKTSLSKNLNLENVSDNYERHTFFFGYNNKNKLSRIYYKCLEENIGGGLMGGSSINNPDEPNIIFPDLILTEKNLLTITYTDLSDYGENIHYYYSNATSIDETYDKYNRLVSKTTSGNNNYNVSFTYVDPNDSNASPRGNARLSNIVDNYPLYQITTSYGYNDDNQISSISISGGYRNLSISYAYSSDYKQLVGEVESSILSLELISVSKVYARDYLTNDVKSILSTVNIITQHFPFFTSYIINESKTIDSLSRLSSMKTSIGSIAIGYDIEYYNNSSTPDLTSNEIKKITYTDNSYDSYEYDNNGNITKAGSINYTYDDNNQLIFEGQSFINCLLFEYDNYGNILNVKKRYMNNVTTLSSFEYSSKKPNLLIKYTNEVMTQGEDILYDSMLNPLNLNGASLSYVRVNMLSTYSKGSTNAAYFYNYEGIRTKKVIGSTTHHYLLNGHNIVREYVVSNNNTDTLVYLYAISGIIGFIYNTILYLYEKDIFKNINKIYQISGSTKTLVAKYNYDAYGNTKVLNPNGTENTTSTFIGHINPFRYRSYYYDEESGYYYCNHRYYVPFIYRWLNMDDLSYLDSTSINGINLFAYCKNNPVMYVDPEGESFLLVLAIIATGVATLLTISDVIVLANNELKITVSKNKDNVSIEGSHKIKTPWVRFAYLIYLNYFNSDTKDAIQGSTFGAEFEWFLHNVAYMFFGKDEAKDVDLGNTIFADNHLKKEEHYASVFMWIAYFVTHPIAFFIDSLIDDEM